MTSFACEPTLAELEREFPLLLTGLTQGYFKPQPGYQPGPADQTIAPRLHRNYALLTRPVGV